MSNSKSRTRYVAEPVGTGAALVDLRKLAEARLELDGELDLASCERVADQLAARDPDNIAYRITGGRDTQGWPTATIALEGRVSLVCQRCLRPFDYRLESRSTVRLAGSEHELEGWDAEEIEAILAAGPLDRDELIEDELLLALPYAPMHPPEECPAGTREQEEAPAKANPFARLAQLKER